MTESHREGEPQADDWNEQTSTLPPPRPSLTGERPSVEVVKAKPLPFEWLWRRVR